LHDVHVQALFEAAFGDERAQLVGTAFGLVVDDQFEAGQQTAVRPAQTTRPSRDPGDPDLDPITRKFSLWRS